MRFLQATALKAILADPMLIFKRPLCFLKLVDVLSQTPEITKINDYAQPLGDAFTKAITKYLEANDHGKPVSFDTTKNSLN